MYTLRVLAPLPRYILYQNFVNYKYVVNSYPSVCFKCLDLTQSQRKGPDVIILIQTIIPISEDHEIVAVLS